jgi:hypothetical protein
MLQAEKDRDQSVAHLFDDGSGIVDQLLHDDTPRRCLDKGLCVRSRIAARGSAPSECSRSAEQTVQGTLQHVTTRQSTQQVWRNRGFPPVSACQLPADRPRRIRIIAEVYRPQLSLKSFGVRSDREL